MWLTATRGRQRSFVIVMVMMTNVKAVYAKSETFAEVGDVLQIGIPASALVVSVAKSDSTGAIQLFEGALRSSLTTHTLKVLINSKRPNGRDYSMPSGHASAAAQGAAYLQFRYGWQYGVPAYLLTGVVGYSRVYNDYNHWRDIAVGAALATATQYSITVAGLSITHLAVVPVVSDQGVGVIASLTF